MTTEQFVYWLQGFLEIADPTNLNEKQIQIIRDHIGLVLDKQTPNRQIPVYPYTPPQIPLTPPTIICETGTDQPLFCPTQDQQTTITTTKGSNIDYIEASTGRSGKRSSNLKC